MLLEWRLRAGGFTVESLGSALTTPPGALAKPFEETFWLLVLVTLPVPYRLGREALSQLLAQSPPAEQRARVEQAIQEGFRDAPVQTLEIKTIKVGRQWDVRIQATLEAQASTLTVSEADGFRRAVQERLATLDEEVQVAVVLRPSGAPHFG